MTPIKHPNCNETLLAPIGSENCEDLPIQRTEDSVWSFWKPSGEELAAIIVGGEIALRVVGATHPPVWIGAMTPTEVRHVAGNEAEATALFLATRDRLAEMRSLMKRTISAWCGGRENERQKLADEFLDVMMRNHERGQVVEDIKEASAEPAAVTQADVDRYRSDAAEWRAEAARWRDAAEQLRESTAVDSKAFKDAAQWQAEAERLEGKLRAVSDALGPDWNVFEFPYAITVIKDRLAKAESALDEWKAEVNRWRALSEAKQMDIDRLEGELRAEIDTAEGATQTDGQRTGDAGFWMNECLHAERGVKAWRSAAAAKQKRIDDAIEVLSTMTAPHKVDLPELPNPNHPN